MTFPLINPSPCVPLFMAFQHGLSGLPVIAVSFVTGTGSQPSASLLWCLYPSPLP